MQLKMSLPERPGWIFVIPGFDFIALLLALVMTTGSRIHARVGGLKASEIKGEDGLR